MAYLDNLRMSTFPGSPRLVKGAFILDRGPVATKRVIFQYNPDSLQRTLTPQPLSEGGQLNPQPYHVKGQPVETISLTIEFDATDQLEYPDQNPTAASYGAYPQLAALESIMRPSTTVPVLATPFVIFEWGSVLVVPVILTSYTVIVEAFDPNLNPVRVKAAIQMRVLTPEEFLPGHPGKKLCMDYLTNLERLASLGYK